jgi:hypothetical protein
MKRRKIDPETRMAAAREGLRGESSMGSANYANIGFLIRLGTTCLKKKRRLKRWPPSSGVPVVAVQAKARLVSRPKPIRKSEVIRP